jgi:hypothetical protein
LDLPCYCADNLFGIFIFAESLKEQLQIEQKDKIRKKSLKDNMEICEFISQDIWVDWLRSEKPLNYSPLQLKY